MYILNSTFARAMNQHPIKSEMQNSKEPFWNMSVLQPRVRHSTVVTRVGTLIVATIYLQLIQNRYMLRSFTVLQCSHQHCVQPVASDVDVVRYL